MHKLRPAFTEDLAARLAEGACINLVSPHGQGRRRTLADLYGCLPSSMQVLQANLRHYPQSLAAMLADPVKRPATPFEAYTAFEGAPAFRNRPQCVLLPIDSLLAAFDAEQA